MNTENLFKLATYLESGNLKAKFDMREFSEDGMVVAHFPTCGSVGCAVGHGPYAGIPKIEREDWYEYSERAFGLRPLTRDWNWCFGASWVNEDNTPEGAARICHLVLHGHPPASFII